MQKCVLISTKMKIIPKCKDGTNSPPRMNYSKLIYNRRFDSVADDRTIGNFSRLYTDLDKNSSFGKFGLFKLILSKLHFFLTLSQPKAVFNSSTIAFMGENL